MGASPLSFGEWTMSRYGRDGFPGSRSHAIGNDKLNYRRSSGSAAYHFVITPEARDEWSCRCEHRREEQGIGLGTPNGDGASFDLTYAETLECDLQRAGDAEPWKLEIHGSLWINGEGFAGTLTRGSHSVALEPSHEITGLGRVPGPPMGYVFVRDGEKVASAEMIHPGFVRIHDAAGEDRDAIATAAAALLMHPGAY
jgi:hypothetical protein